MQIITCSGIAKYIFPNDAVLAFEADRIVAPGFDIGDLNNSNSILFLDVDDVPEDWCGDWYSYDGAWGMTVIHPNHPNHIAQEE